MLKRLRNEFFRASSKIIDVLSLDSSLAKDIEGANENILIVSPFLKLNRVKQFLSIGAVKNALKRGVKITVITRPASGGYGGVGDPKEHRDAMETLQKNGVEVFEKEKLHFKAVIIDDGIIYLGSINILSIMPIEFYPPDYMIRFESEGLVDEIMENILYSEIS
ncbi:MAG TPA: hypothetical protein EYP33_01305 [Pyrodictium sp.]|nr:hypothetical protein [Pyrodictium sp.]